MNDQQNLYSSSDDVLDLLGVYVLDAVDDVERRRVERAAAANTEIAEEIERLRRGLDLLADASEMEPPQGLWDSIRTSLDDELNSQSDRGSSSLPATPQRSMNRPFFLAAAAIVAVLVIGGAAIVRLSGSTSPTDSVATMTAMANDAASKPGSRQGVLSDPGNTMEVKVIVDAEGHGFVMTDPLPALPEGETYQLWSAANGTMVSLGMLGPNPTMSLVPIDATVTELALTREPAQGSVSPTSSPMATGQLAEI